jgi:glycosyltransferase involved in cell wall biosynthesis
MAWQQFGLPAALRRERCGVLFAPGGLLPLRPGVPAITMSRNMLPFEPAEVARLGRYSRRWVKMQLLKPAQVSSMRRADGLIFLTGYARRHISKLLGRRDQEVRVIPHGLAERFFSPPRPAVPREALGGSRPFRLLYVSVVDMYKHQWHLVEAVGELRREGLPVRLDLIGSSLANAKVKLDQAMAAVDPDGDFITYHDSVPFEELHKRYAETDAFVYASSCENLPNILLEAMAAGLPIASSNMGPMPEILGEAGVYFDPLDVGSVANAIRLLIGDHALRDRLAGDALARARSYSWTRCAEDTFAFIGEIARRDAHRVA